MNNDDNIDVLVWDYIDGNLNEEQYKAIEHLIKNDARWGTVYADFMSFNTQLSTTSTISDPPLRFTKNVMEQIASEQLVHSKKVYINPFIIKGIASIFIITISISVLYLLSNTKWTYTSETSSFNLLNTINAPTFKLEAMFEGYFMNMIIFTNVVLVLALLDTFLTQKQNHHSKHI